MSTGQRLAALAAVIVVAIGGLVIARGGEDDKTTTTATTSAATTEPDTGATEETTTTAAKPAKPRIPVHRVTVRNAKPVGGVRRLEFKKGDQVRLVVKSDTADEVHIHGYDISKAVAAGGTVRFGFKAKSDGSYEIELENRGEPIAQLVVEP